MQAHDGSSKLRATLDELDALLSAERSALRSLDARAVHAITARKVEMNLRLQETLKSESPTRADVEQLTRVLERLKSNQILIVHAKGCIRSTLEAATGRPVHETPTTRPPGPLTVRLNVQG